MKTFLACLALLALIGMCAAAPVGKKSANAVVPNIDVDTVVPETPPLALVESTATPTCDASAPPDNGGVGDCTSALAAGSSCQPTCNSGYTVTGVTTCVAATSEHEDNAFKWTQSDTTLTAA